MEIIFSSLESRNAVKYSSILGKQDPCIEDASFVFPSRAAYDPFGMLLTSAALRQFKRRNPSVSTHIKLDKSASSCQYAGHMGFFKAISKGIDYGKLPGEAAGSSSYVPITKIDLHTVRQRAFRQNIPIQQQIQTTSEKLGAVLAQGNSSLKDTLTYVIREIIRNSEEHSNADSVWLCAQHWPYYHLVEIGILDEGIGVRRSLRTNRHYSSVIKTDEDALRFSVLPGISEAYRQSFDEGDPWANSGYGLYIAKEICTHLGVGGLFLLASGNSCIGTFTGERGTESFTKESCISGTAICMRFRTDSIDNFPAIRNDIITQGHAEASKIKKAIKKASYSSGGLIDLLK